MNKDSEAQKQRPHELLWMVSFDKRVYLNCDVLYIVLRGSRGFQGGHLLFYTPLGFMKYIIFSSFSIMKTGTHIPQNSPPRRSTPLLFRLVWRPCILCIVIHFENRLSSNRQIAPMIILMLIGANILISITFSWAIKNLDQNYDFQIRLLNICSFIELFYKWQIGWKCLIISIEVMQA